MKTAASIIPTIPLRDEANAYQPMETKTQIDQQFEQINQQFSELNLQYTHNYGFEQTAGQGSAVENNYNLYEQQQPQSLNALGSDNSTMYGNEQHHSQQQQFDQVPNEQSDYWNQQNNNERDSRDTSHSPSLPSIENVEPEPDVSMPHTNVLRKRNNVRFKTDTVNESRNQLKTNQLTAPSLSHKGKTTRQMSVLKVNKKLSGSVKKKGKKVVFNGTFPIDDPISSRFSGANESSDDDNDNSEEDGSDADGYEEPCDRGVSIEELVVDPKVKLNYKKMMNEYERSFAAFDQLMASRNMQHLRNDFNTCNVCSIQEL
ncbi:hypothetical protein Bhyg_15089 [Pseudolycoriella hygida]|uniref:Uncharacterized protein n=1 Tax=Pseudolycoriella hygida TaxID=35572 RepID=A0A9Q0MT25_9DIPT|nr:hypothetical protein Bhyg_15089 [Pseudolycoriella hygida]